ncbi:FMN-linked oxidoreductase [Hymenopellis radicata]|nr:FMN-linked oxidoreductase [Hymenopellis radicata]
MDNPSQNHPDLAFEPIVLPHSGIRLPNRLVKVAMYEHLSSIFGGPPNNYHFALYANWAKYDWGMIITGNVQVCHRHLTLGRDMVVPKSLTESAVAPFRRLSESMNGKVSIMQLSHAGRQSSNIIGGRLPLSPPLAPSAVALTGRSEGFMSTAFHRLLFQTPRAMTLEDIDEVVDDFLRGATLAWKAGFHGVELHVAHGYLLSQFLSPHVNLRTDEYSCTSTANALRVLRRIVAGIRRSLPSAFILGIKFSTENTSSSEESRALDYIRSIASWGLLDFIEISGGDYSNPEFMASMPPASARQAMFARFSEKVSTLLASSSGLVPLVMLTGGLRSPALCHSALAKGQTDLLGIGRGAILCPDTPGVYRHRMVLRASDTAPFGEEPDTSGFGNWILKLLPRISLVGAGTGMAWYVVMLRRLAHTRSGTNLGRPSYGVSAIAGMWLWIVAPELNRENLKSWAGWIVGFILVVFVAATMV